MHNILLFFQYRLPTTGLLFLLKSMLKASPLAAIVSIHRSGLSHTVIEFLPGRRNSTSLHPVSRQASTFSPKAAPVSGSFREHGSDIEPFCTRD
jgi:hypothetical protein